MSEREKTTSSRTPRVRRARGAVAVEMVILALPVFFTFFSAVQIMDMATARLLVKHATIAGARAAAVFSNQGNVTPDQPQGLNQDKVEAAVKSSVGGYTKFLSFEVEITDNSNCDDPYGPVTVKVRATYKCRIPLGLQICKAPGLEAGSERSSVVLKDEFTMPHQGAKYKGTQSGGGCE